MAQPPTSPVSGSALGAQQHDAAVRIVGAGYKFKLTQLPHNTAPITRQSNAAHHMQELLSQMHEVDLFDSLRPWLKNEKIFYEHEDAETAPIRLGTQVLLPVMSTSFACRVGSCVWCFCMWLWYSARQTC